MKKLTFLGFVVLFLVSCITISTPTAAPVQVNKPVAPPPPTQLPAGWWPDTLIGTWQGNVTAHLFQSSPVYQQTITIKRGADGKLVAIDGNGEFPEAVQDKYQQVSDTDSAYYYCFVIRDPVATIPEQGNLCFKIVNNNTLYYSMSAIPDANAEGNLTRIK